MWLSWVTTPTASRTDDWVAARTSTPLMRTSPPVTSYSRDTNAEIVVLPAPEGPTSATSSPAWAVNETSYKTCVFGEVSRIATDSSEASETSAAAGYRNCTWSNSMMFAPAGRSTASGASAIIGGRSSTSKTRSNDTSAVMIETLTFDRAVSGP